MRNLIAVRTGFAGMLLLAAMCVLPPRGARAGDGAVLNGIHVTAAGAKALKARPDTTRSALLRAVAGTRQADDRKWKMPLIDVRALSGAVTRTAAESVPVSSRQGASGAGLPVALAAVLAAACSTAVILFFVARSSGRGRASLAAPARPHRSAEHAPAAPDDAGYAPESGVPVPEDEDGFFGVGRELRGARGEMALAMRLHSGAMGDGSRRSARSACSIDATTAERVKVAKRLGIGRGEIDLAVRLRKLESTLSTEGKTV